MVDNFSRTDSMHQRRGGIVSLSPAQTPRSSDKLTRESRSCDSTSTNRNDKENGVDVQAIERGRGQIPVVISCNEHRREVAATQSIAGKHIDRHFSFDKVFGPTSEQKDWYDQAICPIVFEVLEGYNCSIFAYGQTGTEKTYKMEGGAKKRMQSYRVTLVLFQELLSRFSTY